MAFDCWQAPDRDTPKAPTFDASVHFPTTVEFPEPLEALLQMDGLPGTIDTEVEKATGKSIKRARRWHKIYERMGLIHQDSQGKTRVTSFGALVGTSGDRASREFRRNLARAAISVLRKFQLDNPADREGQERYPEGTDIHPYWAIWKAIVDLDGKLHWDELNRELMRVLRHADLDAVIAKIRHARTYPDYEPTEGGTPAAPLRDRCFDQAEAPEGKDPSGQVRDQKATPWFRRAGFGGLLLKSPQEANAPRGYWTIADDVRDLVEAAVREGPPSFQRFEREADWFDYFGALEMDHVTAPTSPASSDLRGMVQAFTADCVDALVVNAELVTRLMASLQSKRFVILTGLSGSGKTKLAQAIARWLAPAASNDSALQPAKCYEVVPVGADWTGNDNIIGYPDGLHDETYVTRPALDLIRRAGEPSNAHVPHFLILDEMNLSHVERYFADILSAIESGEAIPIYKGKIRKADGSDVRRELSLPPNLFIIGTVNVDETTYMFSPKVLDRSNVIEFRMDAAELASFLSAPKAPNLAALNGKGAAYGKDFVLAAADMSRSVPEAVKPRFEKEMMLFFDLLREHHAEFGYRTSYEAARFVHFYQLLGNHSDADSGWFDRAMDAVIVQKFLPKLHGSRSKLEGMLWALTWACSMAREDRGGRTFAEQLHAAGQAHDEATFGPESVWAELAKKDGANPEKSAVYPLSFDKVVRMWRKLARDQFTSFAEA